MQTVAIGTNNLNIVTRELVAGPAKLLHFGVEGLLQALQPDIGGFELSFGFLQLSKCIAIRDACQKQVVDRVVRFVGRAVDFGDERRKEKAIFPLCPNAP